MADRWVLTDEDVAELLAVFEQAEATDDGDIFYADVLVGLRRLIPCDDITFQLMDVREQRVNLLYVTDDGVQRDQTVGATNEYEHVFWQEFWKDDGCAGPLRSGDYATILRHSDSWTTREYADTPMGSVRAGLGLDHEVLVPMTPYGAMDRRLLLWRAEGPDFTERELMMLRLVRPHVAELHARRDRELRGEPNLTPRQWEILRQVATGAANHQIARTLGLSEATVRKHLENIFVRLNVNSRTEAVTKAAEYLTR
jgi:DNA-binding CsgD family transcriptional regulator